VPSQGVRGKGGTIPPVEKREEKKQGFTVESGTVGEKKQNTAESSPVEMRKKGMPLPSSIKKKDFPPRLVRSGNNGGTKKKRMEKRHGLPSPAADWEKGGT